MGSHQVFNSQYYQNVWDNSYDRCCVMGLGVMDTDFYFHRLHTLQQLSTVNLYKQRFELLKSLIIAEHPYLEEAYFVSCCLMGLKEEIRRVVQMFQPSSTNHVFTLALLQETILADGAQKSYSSIPNSAAQPLTVCATNLSEFVDDMVGNSVLNEETDADIDSMVVCDKFGDGVYDEIVVHDVNRVENHSEEQLKCTECVFSPTHVSESDVLDMVVEADSSQKEEEASDTSIMKHEMELSTQVRDSEHFWVDKQIVGDYYCCTVLAPATNPMRDKTACYLDNFVSSPKLTKSIICDVVHVGGPTWIPTMQQFLKYFSSDMCFDPGISCSDKIRFHIFSKMFSIQCSVTIHVLSGIELFVQNEQLRWLLIFSLSFNPQGNLVVELVYSWPREKYSENMSQIQSYEDKAYGLFGISLCCSHVAAPIKFKDLIFEGYKLELLPNYTLKLSRSIRIINGQYFLPFKESVTEFNITQVWTVIQALQPNFESSIPAFEVGNGYIAYMVIRFCCSLELQISGNANSGLVILLAVELFLVKLQSSCSMCSREGVLDKDRVAETHSDADNTSVDEVCVRGVWLHGVLDYISLQWHGQVSTSSYTYLAPEQGHFLNILHLPTVWILHNFIERNALEKRMEATVLTMQLYSSVPMCTCAMDEKNLVYSYTGICDYALSMDSIILSSTEQPPHDFKGYNVNEHLKGDILSCLVSSGYICEVEYSGHRTKFCAFVAAGQCIISMILLWDSICSRVRLKNHRCLLCLVVHSSAPVVEWILSVLVILSNFRMLRTHKWHVLSVKKFNTDSTTVLHSSHCKSALHTTQGYKLSHGLILPEHTVGDHSGTAIQLFLLPQSNAVGYWVLVLQGANSCLLAVKAYGINIQTLIVRGNEKGVVAVSASSCNLPYEISASFIHERDTRMLRCPSTEKQGTHAIVGFEYVYSEYEYSGRNNVLQVIGAVSRILHWDFMCSLARLKNHSCMLGLVFKPNASVVECILSGKNVVLHIPHGASYNRDVCMYSQNFNFMHNYLVECMLPISVLSRSWLQGLHCLLTFIGHLHSSWVRLFAWIVFWFAPYTVLENLGGAKYVENCTTSSEYVVRFRFSNFRLLGQYKGHVLSITTVNSTSIRVLHFCQISFMPTSHYWDQVQVLRYVRHIFDPGTNGSIYCNTRTNFKLTWLCKESKSIVTDDHAYFFELRIFSSGQIYVEWVATVWYIRCWFDGAAAVSLRGSTVAACFFVDTVKQRLLGLVFEPRERCNDTSIQVSIIVLVRNSANIPVGSMKFSRMGALDVKEKICFQFGVWVILQDLIQRVLVTKWMMQHLSGHSLSTPVRYSPSLPHSLFPTYQMGICCSFLVVSRFSDVGGAILVRLFQENVDQPLGLKIERQHPPKSPLVQSLHGRL